MVVLCGAVVAVVGCDCGCGRVRVGFVCNCYCRCCDCCAGIVLFFVVCRCVDMCSVVEVRGALLVRFFTDIWVVFVGVLGLVFCSVGWLVCL